MTPYSVASTGEQPMTWRVTIRRFEPSFCELYVTLPEPLLVQNGGHHRTEGLRRHVAVLAELAVGPSIKQGYTIEAR
jgi:hypothetical protein